MTIKFRSKTDKWLFALSLLIALGYLVSLLGWYISNLQFWLLGLAALGFVYLWMLIFIIALYWLIRKKIQLTAVYLSLFLLGWSPATASFSVGMEESFEIDKPQGALRVMQWNANELSGNQRDLDTGKYGRLRAVEFLQKYQPDVICIQDYSEIISRHNYSNRALLSDTLGYKNAFIEVHSYSLHFYGFVQQGLGIFSKVPFIDSGSVPYEGRDFPEYIVWADLPLQGERVRIVSTHFRSMNLRWTPEFEKNYFPVYQMQDSAVIMSGKPLLKLRFYQKEHAQQAALLRRFLDTCSVPVILCADLNTVPASHTYQRVRGDLRDDFLTTTIGLGATYNYLAPNIRIDYMFSNKLLRRVQWKHFDDGFSDHDPLLGDYIWRKDDPL